MKPIGPLMIEHRTIEKMVALLSLQLRSMKENGRPDPIFLATAVDFFRTYADRTHHGKEEDILFKALEKKNLTPELRRIMKELVAEHIIARRTVKAINDAMAAYAGGDHNEAQIIMENLNRLVELYPRHIQKEDKRFFYPAQEYFDEKEQTDMLQAFWDFDRSMVHEKYRNTVEEMKARLAKSLA